MLNVSSFTRCSQQVKLFCAANVTAFSLLSPLQPEFLRKIFYDTGSNGSQLCQKVAADQYVAFIERLWAQIRSAEGLRLPSIMGWLLHCMLFCAWLC